MAAEAVRQLWPGVMGVFGRVVWSYLLVDGDDVVAVDTGMFTHGQKIKRWFRKTGRKPSQLRAILLTHGHLDHVGCAAELQSWSGAPIYLHPADQALGHGKYRGPWPSSFLAGVERVGNILWWMRRFRVDHRLEEGMPLPFWGGLEVIHLPGHTEGQVAFYSREKKILFVGDAILSRGPRVFFPSKTMNLDNTLARTIVVKLADLDVDWVFPAHHEDLAHNLIDDVRRYAESLATSESTP